MKQRKPFALYEIIAIVLYAWESSGRNWPRARQIRDVLVRLDKLYRYSRWMPSQICNVASVNASLNAKHRKSTHSAQSAYFTDDDPDRRKVWHERRFKLTLYGSNVVKAMIRDGR